MRTWADWDDAQPGFVEIDLVSHDGGNPAGQFAFTLTVTDIATGWTENRSVPSKAATCVFRALKDVADKMPFPILGVDSDNGSEFINIHLLQWCEESEITFTRARPGNKNDNCHVEQKNWAVVRTWSATTATTPLRNVATQRDLAAAVQADQLLLPAAETDIQGPRGAKVSKKYDTAATPFHRAINHPTMTVDASHPCSNPRSDQPRRHPATDSDPGEPTPHPDHQQSRPAPQSQSTNAHLPNEATKKSYARILT